ncbi:MAG: hypothetical protein ABIA63_04050, partial [bacterium]
IFIITGDHGMSVNPVYDLDLSLFNVPCLIIGPQELMAKGRRIKKVCSQTDIYATLMHILRIPYSNCAFSRNMFDSADEPGTQWALLGDGSKIGFVTDRYYCISRIKSRRDNLYDYAGEKPADNLAEIYPETTCKYRKNMYALLQSVFYLYSNNLICHGR